MEFKKMTVEQKIKRLKTTVIDISNIMKNLNLEKEYTLEDIKISLYLVASEVRLLTETIGNDYEEELQTLKII